MTIMKCWLIVTSMAGAVDEVAVARLGRTRTALLTTFRSSGTPISTPVSITMHGGRVYFVTAAGSGKAKRLTQNNQVGLAACTVGGMPTAQAVAGTARLRQGHARRHASRVLRPTGALFWSYLLYRIRGNPMNLYEVTLTQPAPDPAR